jgi:hypothetical protein
MLENKCRTESVKFSKILPCLFSPPLGSRKTALAEKENEKLIKDIRKNKTRLKPT